ncbi:transposase IS4 [Nitzschia inconspicua]|uniref:Transposase IS4 n=1 Tax=Nitzschia inconspicua TaxID=303405 RepID=A0A9K3LHB8_9STRA|nr:transposase IS4 [Nitzschia inconspicua]
MSSEQYRWLLVDDFVEEFNEHMVQAFDPSEHICVDESISRWYGQDGHWTNMGLPMYVAIDRKPENGCEIQNATCGQSGFMLRLKLGKTAAEESTTTQVHNESLLHGTALLKFLVSPWRFCGRIVCADSYFASVGAAEELKQNGLKFIGVVKTATKKFPMAHLQAVELQGIGDRRGLVARDDEGNPSLIACVWMDRERRYFISNANGLAPGTT